MAHSDKIAKRKTPSSFIKDDPLAFLTDPQLGLSFSTKPVTASKRSKVDTIKGGGDSNLALVPKSSKTPRIPSRGKGKGVFTLEFVARDAFASCHSTDRPYLVRPTSSQSPQLLSRTVSRESHLLPTMTALTDFVSRIHLREVWTTLTYQASSMLC